MRGRVDVLILTAAEGEDDGVLAVREGRLGDWQKGERFGYPVWFADFRSTGGGVLRVALARPVEMGGEHTATTASPLVQDLKPQCLAMCGVCAGRPGYTNLGDVVIASKTWRYDTGEIVRQTSGDEPEIRQDVATYQIAAPWLPKAQAAAKACSDPAQRRAQWPAADDWLATRPLDDEVQGLWLLRELAEGRDPLAAPDREQRCPRWEAVLAQLEGRGHLRGADLTDAGREHVRTTLFRNRGKLPEPSGWRVHVGPLATGNRLIRDVAIWGALAKTERLTYGLDREASALAQTGWVHGVEHALVVKGVSDYAEPERHRDVCSFAARAAAEVLLRFLRETLSPREGGLADLLSEGTGAAAPQNNPSTLLNARYEVVPFLDAPRSRELALLAAWCDDPSPAPSVRVFTGPGGAGKTRLLLEWCRRLRQRGWVAGFLPHDADAYFAALDARAAPTLLVLDYAEACFGQLEALLRHLGSRRGAAATAPCRVALLARHGGEWLESLQGQSDEAKELLGAAAPIALTPLPVAPPLRATIFEQAARAFAARLGKSAPDAAPDLNDPRFERPLYVHLAALAAVEGRPLEPDRLLADAVDHEYHLFWKKAQGEVRSTAFERAAFRLVAALTLRGRTARHDLAALDAQVKGPSVEREGLRGSEPFHDLVADLYPPPPAMGAGYVGGLEPDLLGETLIRRVLSAPTTEPLYLEQVAQGAGEAEVATMLRVLGRIGQRAPEVTERWLVAFLANDGARRALPAWRAALALAEDSPHARLGQLLARQLAQGPPPPELAQTIEQQLPERTVSLRELAVWAVEARLAALPATEAARAERARLQNRLGVGLSEVGRREEALRATQEAVELRRALAEARPDVFLPDLASSLNNLGSRLRELGRREEALLATQEAVGLRRALAEARPDAALPNLAISLTNLGAMLRELGRREEALRATQEAVELHRALAGARPHAFLPNLAGSLSNLGIELSELGRREEALLATQEAVELRRTLAQARPDAFLPALARSLSNLGARLGELGRREEALIATQQAVEHYRALAQAHPDAFRPDLASGLNNLGTTLSNLGRREEALRATQEAVELRRALAEARPDAFLPDLAKSLHNLGPMLSNLNRHEEALLATRQAVEHYRTLARAYPNVFLPDLASSLNNLGLELSDLGRREEALRATQEAVKLRRALAEARPDVFLLDLASSLTNLGATLRKLGRAEEALSAGREALSLFVRLFQVRPNVVRPSLTISLRVYTRHLTTCGLKPSADATYLAANVTLARPEAA
jgi:tetratricopeptide (TPR) repeat protein/nucleoside phosphorylase